MSGVNTLAAVAQVRERKRKIMFDTGTSKTITDVIGYSANDTTLGIHTEDRLFIVNPERVLYHEITKDGPTTK